MIKVQSYTFHAYNLYHFYARQHTVCYSAYNYAIAHPSVRLSDGCVPRAVVLNEGGAGKIGDLRNLNHHISETMQDRTKVAIDH